MPRSRFSTLGSEIRRLRTEAAVTAAELGEAVGVSAKQIRRIERGEQSPSEPTICLIVTELQRHVEVNPITILALHAAEVREICIPLPSHVTAAEIRELARAKAQVLRLEKKGPPPVTRRKLNETIVCWMHQLRRGGASPESIRASLKAVHRIQITLDHCKSVLRGHYWPNAARMENVHHG